MTTHQKTTAGLLVCALTLLPLDSARAAREGLDVYDLLPSSADRDRAASIINKKARVDIDLVRVDSVLVRALQWAVPDPDRIACEEHAPTVIASIESVGRVPAPEDPADLFATLLAQAEEQFLYVDFQGALESVRQARASLPCVDRVVERAQLRSLFLHQAVAYLHSGDPRFKEAFLRMLAVDPRVYLEPEHPPRVQKAFLEAAEAFMSMPPRGLDPSGLDGEVYFDGLPISSVAETRPGTHLVQLVGPSGQVRSQLIAVEPGPGPVPLQSLVDVGLPTPTAVLEALLAGLRTGNLDEPAVHGLETYLVETGQGRVAFAFEAEGLVVEVYEPGVGLLDHSGDTYRSLFRSAPPWSGLDRRSGRGSRASDVDLLEPGAPGNRLAIGATARVGVGGALSGPSAWSGLLDLEVHARVGPSLQAGIFATMIYGVLEGGVGYPQGRVGAIVALPIPLAGPLAIVPSLGYGLGKGPPVDATCDLVPEDDGETLLCNTGDTLAGAGGYSAVLVSHSHGPLGRIELTFTSGQGPRSWSAGLGVQGGFDLATIDNGRLTVGDTSLPYTMDRESERIGILRIDTVVSFGAAF